MHRLSARDLRRSRPHLTLVQGAWTAAVVGWLIVGMSTVGTSYSRPPLWSSVYVANGLILTVAAGIAFIWLVPRTTLAVSAATGVVAALLNAGAAPLWWFIAVAAAGTLAYLAIRDARSRPRGAVVVPTVDVPFERSWAAPPSHHRWLGWGGLAMCVVAAGVGLVVHQVQAADVAAFEARAARVVAEVAALDDEAGTLTVAIDGADREFSNPWYDGEVGIGSPVEVLIDDAGRAVLAGAGQDDPSWLLGAVVALPLVGATVWSRYLAPGRRRTALVTAGAPGVTVRVVCNGEIALVLPVDADWPALELRGLAGHTDREPVLAEIEAREDDMEDWDDGADDDTEAPLPATEADVAAWADGLRAEAEGEEREVLTSQEKVIAEAVIGPDTNGAEPFILVGSWATGRSVALARATGQVWLAEIGEPKPFAGRRRFLRAVRPEAPGWKDDDSAPLVWQERAAQWALANGRWSRWVAAGGTAVLGALLVPWMVPEVWGDDWFGNARLIAAVLVVASGPFWATSWSFDQFVRTSQGFGFSGMLMDETVARDRVELIAPGHDAVGVRLRDPDAMLSLDPEVVRPGASPEAAAAELRAWLDAAPAGAGSGRRPTPALIATALMVAAWAVQLLL